MRIVFLLFIVWSGLLSATVEQMKNEKRYAFIIANGVVSEVGDDKTVLSAKQFETFLKAKGFETMTAYNADRTDLIKTFRTFDKLVEPNAVVAVIYSGRTVTRDAQTWILPAAMDLESLDQLRLSAVSLNFLLTKLQGHRPRVTLAVVDGYGYTAFQNSTDADKLLASFHEMKEADILVQWNGKAKNSKFFPQFVKSVGSRDDDIETITGNLAGQGFKQRITTTDFYFNVPDKILTPTDKAWQRAIAKNSILGYEAFLIAFPDSKYKKTAIERIDTLNEKQHAAAAATSGLAAGSLAQDRQLQNKTEKLKKAEAQLKAQQEELERLKAEQASMVLAGSDARTDTGPKISFIEPAEMVTIPAGVYLMGSDKFENATPVHMVTVESPFKMSAYEVSNKAYSVFLKATGTAYKKKKMLKNESAAVAYVSWEDATRYAVWLSKMSGKKYRLPTEAEWEYAARAGHDSFYSWGDNLSLAPQFAWMAVNAHGFVHSRGLLQPNAFGLFDMAGNVAEWCIDSAMPNYKGAPSISNRAVADQDTMKIIRGGSYKSAGKSLSPSYRESNIPTYRSDDVGFRLVESL